MVDIASFVAQNFQPQGANMLAQAQQLKAMQGQNQLMESQMAQRESALARDEQQRNALASGDVNALAQFDPGQAGQLFGLQNAQQKASAEKLAMFAERVSTSANPKALLGVLQGAPEFQQIATDLQMDFSQMGDLASADDEVIRQEAQSMADALRGASSGANQRRVQSTQILEDGSLALVYNDGEIVNTGERARGFAQKPIEIAGGKASYDPNSGYPTVQLSTAEQETQASATRKQAEAEATASVTPANDRADAKAKLPRMVAAERRLSRVDEAVKKLSSRKFLKGGPFQAGVLSVTDEGQELEQANAQLLAEITALTRIPGVGAQSDFEQRLQQMVLPDARFRPEVNENAVEELHAFMGDLEGALRNVASGNAETANLPAGWSVEIVD